MKKRRNNFWLAIIFISTCFGCSNKSIMQSTDQVRFDSFEIMYIDFATSTLIRVTCDRYEDVFSGDCRRVLIDSPSDVKKMNGYMAKVRRSDRSTIDIDTRMKVVFFLNSSRVGELCVNRFYMVHNGENIEYNAQLKDFLFDFF